jgi:hypothetical protein
LNNITTQSDGHTGRVRQTLGEDGTEPLSGAGQP